MRGSRDSTDVDAQVGARVAGRRAALGLTRAQLAAAVGVSMQQLHKYETGTNRIPASRLLKLATALGQSPGDLFPPILDDRSETRDPMLEGQEMARLVARIPDARARAALTVLAEALAR